MSARTFRSELLKARTFRKLGDRPEYWIGYERGLRRAAFGDRFGTEQEHELWLTFAADGVDRVRRERGQGYRDGLLVLTPETTA